MNQKEIDEALACADVLEKILDDEDKKMEEPTAMFTLAQAYREKVADLARLTSENEKLRGERDEWESNYNEEHRLRTEDQERWSAAEAQVEGLRKRVGELEGRPWLGFATNKELLDELSARIEVHGPGLEYSTVKKFDNDEKALSTPTTPPAECKCEELRERITELEDKMIGWATSIELADHLGDCPDPTEIRDLSGQRAIRKRLDDVFDGDFDFLSEALRPSKPEAKPSAGEGS